MCERQHVSPTFFVLFVSTVLLGITILLSGCGGYEKPPSIGVYLKNPDQDYVKVTGYEWGITGGYTGYLGTKDFQVLEAEVPSLQEGGVFVFYGMDVDFSRLQLGSDVDRNRAGALTGKVLPVQLPANKVGEGLFEVTIPRDSIWSGIWYISYGATNSRAWFFSFRGPKHVVVKQSHGGKEWVSEEFEEDISKEGLVKHGRYVSYYTDGSKKAEGLYHLGKRDSLWTYWDESGWKIQEIGYENGKREFWTTFHKNGKKASEESWANGRRDGTWRYWNDKSEIINEQTWTANNLKAELHPDLLPVHEAHLQGSVYKVQTLGAPPRVVDGKIVQPEPSPTANDRLPIMKYAEWAEYSFHSGIKGVVGVVWVKSLVGTDGRVKESTIEKPSGVIEWDEAALTAASKFTFEPALKSGEPVESHHVHRVLFAVDSY